MGFWVKYTEEENRKINDVANSYRNQPISKEVVFLLCDEINQMNRSAGGPERSLPAISAALYKRKKELQEESSENGKELSLTHVKRWSSLLRSLQDTFLEMKRENAKLSEENHELKEKLRSMRGIRQAVEDYQKQVLR